MGTSSLERERVLTLGQLGGIGQRRLASIGLACEKPAAEEEGRDVKS